MTATADKVEHYNQIEMIKDHIQYYAHYAQVSISALATQWLIDTGNPNKLFLETLLKSLDRLATLIAKQCPIWIQGSGQPIN